MTHILAQHDMCTQTDIEVCLYACLCSWDGTCHVPPPGSSCGLVFLLVLHYTLIGYIDNKIRAHGSLSIYMWILFYWSIKTLQKLPWIIAQDLKLKVPVVQKSEKLEN